MNFASQTFVIFLIAVLAVYHLLLRTRDQKLTFLLAASWIFYATWSLPLVGLLLFVTVFNYLAGFRIEQAATPNGRRNWLALAVIVDLGLLGFFKYAGFLVHNGLSLAQVLGWSLPTWSFSVVLPLGISFYTFQAISYVVDIQRRDVPAVRGFRDFALFLSFFPQLIAGPIVRGREFLPQLETTPRVRSRQIVEGLHWVVVGYFKKVFLADQLALFVDAVFAEPGAFDATTIRWAVVAYAAQVYCDFSGYSDIAIGCGKWLGFELPVNFRFPYLSASIAEFWRRWHISLSSWLRDYLYFPLGGSRAGRLRTCFNLLATFTLCGLWHGASWNYAAWGLYNGMLLCGHRCWRQALDGRAWAERIRGSQPYRVLAVACTLFLVLGGLIFVRALDWSDCWLIERVWLGLQPELAGRAYLPHGTPVLIGMVVLGHLLSGLRVEGCRVLSLPPLLRAACYAAAIFLLIVFAPGKPVPFIYFQF